MRCGASIFSDQRRLIPGTTDDMRLLALMCKQFPVVVGYSLKLLGNEASLSVRAGRDEKIVRTAFCCLPLDCNILHPGHLRPLVQLGYEFLKILVITFSNYLNCAIGPISYPAGQAQLVGISADEKPEPHPLHSACYNCMQSGSFGHILYP